MLDAADELFGQHGVHETQIAQIIDRSGVSAGSLYRFFPDKRSIASALMARYREEMAELAVPLVPAESLEELFGLVDVVVDLTADHQTKNPGFRALATVSSAADPASALYEIRSAQIALMVHLGSNLTDVVDPDDLRHSITYMIVMLSTLVASDEIRASQPERIAEIKRILRAYLADIVRRTAERRSAECAVAIDE